MKKKMNENYIEVYLNIDKNQQMNKMKIKSEFLIRVIFEKLINFYYLSETINKCREISYFLKLIITIFYDSFVTGDGNKLNANWTLPKTATINDKRKPHDDSYAGVS